MKNLNKTTKTLLFASLIAAMILPFNSMDFAEAKKSDMYSAEQVKTALTDIEPYVSLKANKKSHIDVADAKQNGVSKESIKIAREYYKLQDKFMDKLSQKQKPNFKAEKFEVFFESLMVEDNSFGLQSIIPAAYATHACNVYGPHTEPSRISHWPGTTTITSMKNYLLDVGYHNVPWYYSANSSIDYAKKIYAYGCENGVFREQAVINSASMYKTQNPEPNPELFTYDWPTSWWGSYVLAWHVNPF